MNNTEESQTPNAPSDTEEVKGRLNPIVRCVNHVGWWVCALIGLTSGMAAVFLFSSWAVGKGGGIEPEKIAAAIFSYAILSAVCFLLRRTFFT